MLETRYDVIARLSRGAKERLDMKTQSAHTDRAVAYAMDDFRFDIRRIHAMTDDQLHEQALVLPIENEEGSEKRIQKALRATLALLHEPYVADQQLVHFSETSDVSGKRVEMLAVLQSHWGFVHNYGGEALVSEVKELLHNRY